MANYSGFTTNSKTLTSSVPPNNYGHLQLAVLASVIEHNPGARLQKLTFASCVDANNFDGAKGFQHPPNPQFIQSYYKRTGAAAACQVGDTLASRGMQKASFTRLLRKNNQKLLYSDKQTHSLS